MAGENIEMEETFNKKMTLWFSNNKPQEKLIEVMLQVRDGPPQPKIKGGGFKPLAKQKIDISHYYTPSRLNDANLLVIKLSNLSNPNFKEVTANLSIKLQNFDAKDAIQ